MKELCYILVMAVIVMMMIMMPQRGIAQVAAVGGGSGE